MAMIKKLSQMGNSLGVLLEKPILELLNITQDTPLEVSTDGTSIFIRPLRTGHQTRVRAATKAVMKDHDAALRKLAE